MLTVYVMCGVSGSGKSTYAQKILKDMPHTKLISTDAIRKELWGDENDQRRPDVVFKVAYERIERELRRNYDVVFDATNLKVKDRIKLIEFVKGLEIEAEFYCIVMSTSLEECIEAQELRERKVPRAVIEKQYKSMQYPFIDEGWDVIRIIERS